MKLKTILMLLALMMGAFTFVACGEDDEQQPQDQGKTSETNKEVVGTYKGWTHLTTNFIDKVYDEDTLSLAVADDGTLMATFKNKIWGTATINGIQSSKIAAGEGFKLENGEGSFVMNNPRDSSTQEFSCKLDYATISADKTQMTAVIIANMTTAGAHGEMTFTFQTGDMPTEE